MHASFPDSARARAYARHSVAACVTQAGQPVPKFTATAAVSGRTVSDADLKGTGVLVVHGAKTADAAKEVSKAVRTRWPQPQQVFLASIVDLRAFSGLWKRVAEAQVKSTYEKLAGKAKEAGLDPAEQVLICPDWDGAIGKALGVAEPDKEAAAIVVKGGKVVAVATGKDVAAQVMAALS
ncbi:MAG: hypothetical protein QOG31_1283 [Thermoplasmata archaeon]|nr:hypothetical protein [Thermoplasmata archaeon]